MLVTSLKPLDEIRLGNIFALPQAATLESWRAAWSTVCTGVSCEGIRGGFANSLLIALPSTAIAIVLGALNGYALAFWRVAWREAAVRIADARRVRAPAGDDLPAGARHGDAAHFRHAARHRAGARHLQHAGDDLAVSQLLRRGAAGALQCRARRRRPLSAHLSARRAAAVAPDHRRGFDHAGDWRMERLPARDSYSRVATICR